MESLMKKCVCESIRWDLANQKEIEKFVGEENVDFRNYDTGRYPYSPSNLRTLEISTTPQPFEMMLGDYLVKLSEDYIIKLTPKEYEEIFLTRAKEDKNNGKIKMCL